jgi:hypothetical protein
MLSCGRLHVVCCMLSVARRLLHVVDGMLPIARSLLHARGRGARKRIGSSSNWRSGHRKMGQTAVGPVESVNVCTRELVTRRTATTLPAFRYYFLSLRVARCMLRCMLCCTLVVPCCASHLQPPLTLAEVRLHLGAVLERLLRSVQPGFCVGELLHRRADRQHLRRETKTQRQTTCGGRPACSRNQTCTTTQRAERTCRTNKQRTTCTRARCKR